jgi:hypothetical protein
LTGGAMSELQGGKFLHGFAFGAISSAVSSGASALRMGPELMIMSGGLSGGLGSWITGGSFIDGVRQGIISSALNHAMHEGGKAIKNCCSGDPMWDLMVQAGYRQDIMTGEIYDPEGNLVPDMPWYEYLANMVSTGWIGAPFKALSSLFSKGVSKGGGLIAKGLGSTGRTTAANLTEQIAMKEIVSNPTLGITVMKGMKDSRWLGWNKMQYTHTALNGTKTTIHYVGQFKNGVLKAVDDFKFK